MRLILATIVSATGLLAQTTNAIPSKARQEFESAVKAAQSGQPAQAIRDFQRAVADYPGYAEAWQRLAEL